MKIGAMLNSFRRPSFAENLEAAASLGIDGVQFYVSDDLPDDVVADYLSRIKDKGMVFSALCGDIGGYDDPDANREKVDRFKRILDLSKKLECSIVTTHIGHIPEAGEDDAKYKTMFDACKSIADYAASIDATFAIETGPEKARFLRKFLDEIDSKGIGVNLDPANLVMCSEDDPAAAAGIFGKYIVHTHAKDGICTGRHSYLEVPLGQGGVHYDTYLPALHYAGFDGFLTIERECGDTPEKDIGLAVDFLKAMTARYGLNG
ncbi:MAG: sugar phosphate isomerase/epimerase [Clostridia bacterium]|nr:sugar phosphate isomerase/epimerase [Clostridia bacterium]